MAAICAMPSFIASSTHGRNPPVFSRASAGWFDLKANVTGLASGKIGLFSGKFVSFELAA